MLKKMRRKRVKRPNEFEPRHGSPATSNSAREAINEHDADGVVEVEQLREQLTSALLQLSELEKKPPK